VVSGESGAIDEFVEKMTAEGARARRIQVDYASHSHQVGRVRDQVLEALSDVHSTTSELPFYSTLHGELIDTAELTGEYWYSNLRERVLFEPCVRRLAGDGFRIFVEMSPHPVLTVPVQEIVEDLDDAVVLSSARRDRGEAGAVAESLARLYVQGGPVDWAAVLGARRQVELPTYAFQRLRYWLDPPHPAAPRESPADLPVAEEHPVTLVDRVAGLPAAEAEALVLQHVLEKVGVVLGHPSISELDPDQPFREIGFDSLLSVELSRRLTASTGLKLRATLVLRHPSPRLAAGHILSSMHARAE